MFRRITETIRNFSRLQWLLSAAFVVSLLLTSFFAVRTYRRAVFWREHRDQPIAGWMQVGFVARSYSVPPPVVNRAAGLPPDVRDRRPLSDIAESQGRTFDELKLDIERAIAEFRAADPHVPPGGKP